MSELTQEQMREDINFLLARSMKAGCMSFTAERDTGISSNSLVRLAYAPVSVIEMPGDMSDLRACEKAYESLPSHRKTVEVLEALNKQRAAVTDDFTTECG